MRLIWKRAIWFVWPCLAAAAAQAGTGAGSGHDIPNRMMMLVTQLGVILVAARIGHIVFRRIRMPGVLGELVAGIVIGPYGLGAASIPGFPDGLFPPAGTFPISPELYGICALGSVVLLFIVGLETDTRMFLRYSTAGILVGAGGVLVSFVLGDLMAVVFLPMLWGVQVDFLSPSCLLLGIISTATSVGSFIICFGVSLVSGPVIDCKNTPLGPKT